jgi:hypothetical protein
MPESISGNDKDNIAWNSPDGKSGMTYKNTYYCIHPTAALRRALYAYV